MKVAWILIPYALSICVQQNASAAPTLNGRVYTDQYLSSKGPNAGKFEQSNLSAWLDFDAHDESGFGIRVIGQGDSFFKSISEPDHPSFTASLREGYVSYLGPGIEVKIGQQIIPWGKSDGVNPTDYFTAKNFTLLNPDDEVRRKGAVSLNTTFTPDQGNSPFSFQTVIQANAPEVQLLIPDQSVPQGVQFQKQGAASLPFQGRYEVGGRISYLKSNFDLSLSAFRGYSHFPEYILNSSTLTVSPIYPAQTAIGADGSFTANQYILRFESALLMPDNGKETDPLAGMVEPWHWDSVFGAERPMGDDFRAQIQVLYRWHLWFPGVASTGNPLLDSLRSGIARANALILNAQYQGNPGATFRVSYASDHSDFSGDVFLIGYFGYGQDFLLRPQMGYTPISNLKFTLGADVYGGNETRPLGALRNRSHGFFETRYLF
jgi:hypothetical protein